MAPATEGYEYTVTITKGNKALCAVNVGHKVAEQLQGHMETVGLPAKKASKPEGKAALATKKKAKKKPDTK